MKHIKLFETFLSEGYNSVNSREIMGWEKDNGKLPFPSEVLAITKKMAEYGLADDNLETRAHVWYNMHPGGWADMEKFGANVKKFYGSDFYSAFTGYTTMFMKAKAHAASIISVIEDKAANREPVEPGYYETKEWFNSHGIDTKRSRVFDAAVKYVDEWIKKSGIKTL